MPITIALIIIIIVAVNIIQQLKEKLEAETKVGITKKKLLLMKQKR